MSIIDSNEKQPGTVGKKVTTTADVGLKFEGHGSFLSMEGGKWCPSKWVCFQEVYVHMGHFTYINVPIWVHFQCSSTLWVEL